MASRRRFMQAGVLGTSAAAIATSLDQNLMPYPSQALAATAATPSAEVIALNHMAFGPRSGDIAAVQSQGLDNYIEAQLNPASITDSTCDARLAAVRLRIKYDAASDASYPARNEAVALNYLSKTTKDLWYLRNGSTSMNWSERMRPWNEVWVATWLRAVYSKRQLQEVLVDFWHNHFNVYASGDSTVSVSFPEYDQIMRRNCLGNFRTFLEEVAKSTAMLYYLDNVSNRASGGEGGNENFARELLELHTLGSDNYLKFYDDRTQIGTITYGNETFVRGYIDEDVYEASAAFSGWTVANGHWERPTLNDGTFLYDPDWHWTGRKTFLSISYGNIIPNQADLKDGQDVLTLLANHPGTARHLCTKLCRRLISDNPPSSVIDAAVETWMANRTATDQIKRVVRVILRSAEFQSTWGQKSRRPFELAAAYLRATEANMPSDETNANGSFWSNIMWYMSSTGHKLFEWPTPNGHPDLATYWASTNGLLRRWNMPYYLGETNTWGGGATIDLVGQTNFSQSCTQIVDAWIAKLFGYSITASTRQEMISFLAQDGDVNQPPQPKSGTPDWGSQDGVKDRLVAMVQLLAMSPDFQYR